MKSDHELLDEFVGKEDTEQRQLAEQTMIQYQGRTAMGEILFRMHTHGEHCDPDEIVYREVDIRRLLDFLEYTVKFGDE